LSSGYVFFGHLAQYMTVVEKDELVHLVVSLEEDSKGYIKKVGFFYFNNDDTL